MSERTNYSPGTPCWVDLGSPDLEASVDFYGALFGWDVPESENSQQTGGYRQAMKDGKPVAGMMPLMQEGQPPAWSTYVSVDDAEATAAKVTDAGGTVIAEPMEVLDLGKMAIFADPTGVAFGIWQPGTFIGAGLVNEPGAISWNELNTRDPETAKAFYGAVFGWTTLDLGSGQFWAMSAYGDYLEALTPGTRAQAAEFGAAGFEDVVAAIAPLTAGDERASWNVTFGTEDADATAAKATELGGTVDVPPVDAAYSRFTVLRDPQGATFTASAFVPENKDVGRAA